MHSFNLNSFKQHAFMLKIDLAKAFDRVEWPFLLNSLRHKGYSGHFIKLIYACVSTASFAINVNGQPHGDVKATRGIRQGCPLSPYLFVLAINELSICLQNALQNRELTGVTLGPDCPPIHSILFADDLIICGEADLQQVQTIKSILDSFCAASGQTPNWTKSSILFSKKVTPDLKAQIKSFFSC